VQQNDKSKAKPMASKEVIKTAVIK
jgi:hypothetical protein